MIGEAAAWLQATALAQTLRASAWLYPLVNLTHLLGIALLFGAIAALDLRLLGVWRGVPLEALARPLVPVAGAGLGLALATGPLLLTVQAVDYAANPLLYAKFAAIGVGLVNIALLHRRAAWRAEAGGPRLRAAGLVSLASWLGAIAAGRLIAYW
ncbi:MAG: DUF2214 domain-containing protein [Methylobacterium sp.]|uniref:DUF2214 domain-containing protein n=1 Tax=Methylobacterium sp. TaxID=409 RepID=UPI00258CDDC2|nr:DUF2214 domain-containing protein [Methylobacterium sp.]MBY0297124.1 DUF2214 domain-containing protein [Methylobacterium sp.]